MFWGVVAIGFDGLRAVFIHFSGIVVQESAGYRCTDGCRVYVQKSTG